MLEDHAKHWVKEVAEEDFPAQVLEASRQKPILVDFWAAWCGPCVMLAPVLEKLAAEFGGAFVLAKVNVEEAPGLAQTFGIQSIPLVVLFRDGEPVDQFMGALPESEIRDFLRPHCPTGADEMAAQGEQALVEQRPQQARSLFEQVLQEEKEHPGALLGLARLAWQDGQVDQVEAYLERIDPLSQQSDEADALRGRVEFARRCQEWGGLEAARRRLEQRPDDLESAFRLCCCQAAEESYPEALEGLLSIVQKDRRFRDEEPRKAMLKIFKIVGDRSELAEEYRARLSRAIF